MRQVTFVNLVLSKLNDEHNMSHRTSITQVIIKLVSISTPQRDILEFISPGINRVTSAKKDSNHPNIFTLKDI